VSQWACLRCDWKGTEPAIEKRGPREHFDEAYCPQCKTFDITEDMPGETYWYDYHRAQIARGEF
jgi:hypothetical protein